MANTRDDNLEALSEAVARNAGNVISIPSAGLIRNFKSRFLGECEEGIWLEAAQEANASLCELASKHDRIAVSFKGGKLQISFASTVLRLDPQYRMNAEMFLPAVLVSQPTEIKGVQRRAAYRVHIYADSGLVVRLWSVSEQAYLRDRPMAAQELKAEIRDISVGGVGIRVSQMDAKGHQLVADQRLRVQLQYQDIDLLLEGRLRTAPKSAGATGPAITGVVFKKLESDVEGRQKLAALSKIVGELQREEVRRMRLGLAS